jgi:hypothetical protein
VVLGVGDLGVAFAAVAVVGDPISIESFGDSLLMSTETDDDGIDARSCR